MKNGYYVFAYVQIDKNGYLLSCSRRHDQNISLYKVHNNSVSLVRYWELERISGIRHHDISFYDMDSFEKTLLFLLETEGLSLSNIVEIIGLSDNATTTLVDRQLLDNQLVQQYPLHSINHLFSSLLCSTQVFYSSDILCLALDGGPDNVMDLKAETKPYYMGCYSQKGNPTFFSIPSPGIFWDLAKERLEMEEGSLMALASACTCQMTFSNSPNVLCFDSSCFTEANQYIDSLVNQAETNVLKNDRHSMILYDKRFSARENMISMVMKEIQNQSIHIVKLVIDRAVNKYCIDIHNTYISLSGGYALNCPTNSWLMKSYGFKGYVMPPCVNDSGQSLGLALFYFWATRERFTFKLSSAFHGMKCMEDAAVIETQWGSYIEDISDFDADIAVDDVMKEPIAWFDEESEIGPRALGHRSILADPRNVKSLSMLNEVKQRQWWRPVAPIVLKEHLSIWFEESYETPFMLHLFTIQNEKKHLVPAIIHLDNSSRIQSVTQDENSKLYNIIDTFRIRTGVPMICNTSLNDRGEPIINTIDEAMNFCLRKSIGVLYYNGRRYKLRCNMNFSEQEPYKRKSVFDAYIEQRGNFHCGITPKDYLSYTTIFPDEKVDISNERQVRKIVKLIKLKGRS